MKNYDDDPKKRPESSFAEKISFGVSLLLLSLIVGLVVYEWISKKDQPPIVSVTIDPQKMRQVEEQFYVPFTVINTGGETVESVEVIAQLKVNGEVEEEGSQQIDFLSDGETQSGAFIWNRNPKKEELIVRVTGYRLP